MHATSVSTRAYRGGARSKATVVSSPQSGSGKDFELRVTGRILAEGRVYWASVDHLIRFYLERSCTEVERCNHDRRSMLHSCLLETVS